MPITILPFLSIVLERLIHAPLSTFLNKNLPLTPFQTGFRPRHSRSLSSYYDIDRDEEWKSYSAYLARFKQRI